MKKLTMLALAAVVSASAFAQDVSKQISKIKDYKEAYNLLQSNLGSMSAEEKAKCYNALVDLAYEKVIKEQGTITENQMADQLRTEVTPYDTVGLYNAVMLALENGVACDEFDMQPNEKGKVKPKFHNSNADRLYPIRFHLINAGIYYQGKGDDKLSYKYLATYVESADYPLFKEKDKSTDANLTQIAYFAATSAFMAKDYAKAEKYADIALADTAYGEKAMQVKLSALQSQLKTHEDSVNYVNKLKEIYAQNENNEVVFGMICSMLSNLNDKAGVDAFLDAKLAKDPNNFTALAMKGQTYLLDKKFDEAINYLSKAIKIQPTNIVAESLLGQSYMFKAQDAAVRATSNGKALSPDAEKVIVGVYEQAISHFEKAKELDKTMENKNAWAYYLYRCYYTVYGADDQRTKDAELLTK